MWRLPLSKGERASLALSEPADDSPALIRSLKPLGLIELSLGDPGKAVEYLERGFELEAGAGYGPAVLRILPDVIEALLATGRVQDARPLAEGLEAQGRRLDRPWALATAARARGLLEAASGDVTQAQTALEGALREHERLPQPFELARCCSSWGASGVAPSADERPRVTRTGTRDLPRAGSQPLDGQDPSRARTDRRTGRRAPSTSPRRRNGSPSW
jgi:hypothetical protein